MSDNRVIHQFMSGMSPGDAVSNHALFIQKTLRDSGITSEIFSDKINPKLKNKIIPITLFQANPNVEIIHHLCQYSITADILKSITVKKKIVIYHNITPGHYFRLYHEPTANDCINGREQLKALAYTYDAVYGDSSYNCDELSGLYYPTPTILPISFDFDEYSQAPDPSIIQKYQNDNIKNILFVGRMAPNKKIEDLIQSFSVYHQQINKDSRLILVGSHMGAQDIYYSKLKTLINDLNLKNHVYFTGHIPFNQILAYYKIADLFLCTSEHEGFCVPLLESMFFDLPILAYSAAAIPETLADAGILFHEKNYNEIALLMREVLENQILRAELINNGHRRLEYFHPDRIKKIILKNLV